MKGVLMQPVDLPHPMTPQDAGRGAEIGPPIEWTLNAWRDHQRRGALALLSLVLMWWLVYSLALPPLTTLVLSLAVFAWLTPGFSSWRCRVDDDGVSLKRFFLWDRRPWGEIRRARVSRRGLFVSPYATPGVLDSFRSLYLPVPEALEDRDRLLSELRRRITEHGF